MAPTFSRVPLRQTDRQGWHRIECVGFRIAENGSALAYAADTRPCLAVTENAKGADLLVHEAYSLNGDAEQAHAFGHSTAGEAGTVPVGPDRSVSS